MEEGNLSDILGGRGGFKSQPNLYRSNKQPWSSTDVPVPSCISHCGDPSSHVRLENVLLVPKLRCLAGAAIRGFENVSEPQEDSLALLVFTHSKNSPPIRVVQSIHWSPLSVLCMAPFATPLLFISHLLSFLTPNSLCLQTFWLLWCQIRILPPVSWQDWHDLF